MNKNKTSKPASSAGRYLKYAIGEIVLVVIGILIAFQINNWNENRKHYQTTKILIKSLKNDLKLDSIQLNEDILALQNELEILYDFTQRLSGPYATIDTLKQIARHEYLPFFDPSNELNRNTIISLLSTGNIDYFSENIKSKILSHNSDQLKLLKIMDQNVSIFLGSQYAQGIVTQSENPYPMMRSASIRGPLLEEYWANKKDDQFLETMLSTISGKILMEQLVLWSKKNLLEKTNEMLGYLNNWEKDNE